MTDPEAPAVRRGFFARASLRPKAALRYNKKAQNMESGLADAPC